MSVKIACLSKVGGKRSGEKGVNETVLKNFVDILLFVLDLRLRLNLTLYNKK